jgi:heme/copper-type cytochrome/quinol oxidase subunit 2
MSSDCDKQKKKKPHKSHRNEQKDKGEKHPCKLTAEETLRKATNCNISQFISLYLSLVVILVEWALFLCLLQVRRVEITQEDQQRDEQNHRTSLSSISAAKIYVRNCQHTEEKKIACMRNANKRKQAKTMIQIARISVQ